MLWGGEQIPALKHIITDSHNVGESWEISSVEGSESVVADGDDAGLSISEIINKYGSKLMGKANYAKYGNRFPLLIKFIDAKQDLSVQVHPNDELAKLRHNCNGKTEMWYILSTTPGAKIYSGLTQKITPKEYEVRVAENTIMDVVATHLSKPGEIYLLPSGRIHSIGAGNLLLEIQQTSNITYRIYDFDRRDVNGKKRELHTDLAKDAIDYTVQKSYITMPPEPVDGIANLEKCDYFDVKSVAVSGCKMLDLSKIDSFLILIGIDGNAVVTDNFGNKVEMCEGTTVLFPAVVEKLTIEGNAKLITATT